MRFKLRRKPGPLEAAARASRRDSSGPISRFCLVAEPAASPGLPLSLGRGTGARAVVTVSYRPRGRLRVDGLVEVDCEEIVDSRLRRYYRLTAVGTERLADEAVRLRANATVAMTRLGSSAGMVRA